MPAHSSPQQAALRPPENRRERTYRRIYPMRVLGMGLGGLAIASVLFEQRAPWPLWAWMLASCFAWPHLAFLFARHAGDPYAAERRNLLLDSAIAGMSIPLMHFCLLPSAILATVTTFDKLSTGMRRLWLQSLPFLFGGVLLGTLVLRPQPQLEGSLLVVACSLPLLVVHTLSTGLGSYHLLRTIARQNHLLEQMRRTDAQTGLLSREHLLEHAGAALRAYARDAWPACLVMIDIDHFKSINDSHGHGAGDEAIAAVAQAIWLHPRRRRGGALRRGRIPGPVPGSAAAGSGRHRPAHPRGSAGHPARCRAAAAELQHRHRAARPRNFRPACLAGGGGSGAVSGQGRGTQPGRAQRPGLSQRSSSTAMSCWLGTPAVRRRSALSAK